MALGIDNKIYAIGGVGRLAYSSKGSNELSANKESVLSSVEVYDSESNCWRVIKEMKVRRAKHCVVTMPDAIYVFGGFDGDNYLNSVEKFNFYFFNLKNRYDFISQE